MVIGVLLLSWNVASVNVPRGLLQQPPDTLRLCAVGDLNLDRRVVGAGLLQGDTLYPFRPLLESLRGADITFGNLESPIVDDATPVPDSGGVFAAPPLAALALARAGFDIVSTANNHAWDGGQPAAEETMRLLTRAGVRFVGSGFGRDMAEQPVILERRGWRVAFFAVTRAWNPAPYTFYKHAGANWVAWGDTAWVFPAIRALKSSGRADLIVVSVHGGREYADEPPDYHRDLLYGLVDAGADLVLAHHPHVLQPVVRQHEIRAGVDQAIQQVAMIVGRLVGVFPAAVHAHHDQVRPAARLECADGGVNPGRVAPRHPVGAGVLVEAVRRRIPGAGDREERHPPAPALEDHRLLCHVAPEPRANEAYPGAREQPHRLLGGGLPAVPRVVVGRAHDVEAGARQGEGGERGRGEHTPRVGNGRRVGGDRAFEVAEGDVRSAQRLEQGPEWIECVTLQQSRPGDAPVEVQVPYCTQPQRVGGPLTRLTRHVHRRHVPRKQHQADHHTVSWPSTSHQRCETLGRVHQTGPRT